jgi:hypothetical protein
MVHSVQDIDKRNQPRVSTVLRADAIILSGREREDILCGNGYPDLDHECPALSSPRSGHLSCLTRDISLSGLGLLVAGLTELEPGACLELDLHLPGERRVVKFLADVVWLYTEPGRDFPMAGLRFAAIEDEGLRRLKGYLEPIQDSHL